MGQHQDFLRRLKATFEVEAREHLQTISSGMLQLEKAGSAGRQPLVESVFRAAHSLKGAARAMGLHELEASCHALENTLANWKRDGAPDVAEPYDRVHKATDLLARLITYGEGAPHPRSSAVRAQIELLVGGLDSTASGQHAHAAVPETPGPNVALQPPANGEANEGSPGRKAAHPLLPDKHLETPNHPIEASPPGGPIETIRVGAAKIDQLMLQTEELLAVKESCRHLARGLKDANVRLKTWRKVWARLGWRAGQPRGARASLEAGEAAESSRRLAEFLEWNSKLVLELSEELGALSQSAQQAHRAAATAIDQLGDEMKRLLMRPFGVALEGLPRITRDLARELGKDVELVTRCSEIEIDRRILEEMKDPLLHMLRNSLDHGIETPAERQHKGKSRRGTITITLEQLGTRNVELVVSDDGAGLDPNRLRDTAVRNRFLREDEAVKLDEDACRALVFHSGFSCSPIITNLSGRGLGLSIVREKVEKLGGWVRAEAGPGGGAVFRVRLPTTRATFRGVIVRLGDERYVFPTPYVERVARVRRGDVKKFEGQDSIRLDGRFIPLVPLQQPLEIRARPDRRGDSEVSSVVIATAEGVTVGFVVSEVLNEHEILVKSLGAQLPRVRNVEGATALEGGSLVLILNVSDLMKSVMRGARSRIMAESASQSPQPAATRKRILVVEDSITSRTLLRNILEGAHYEVRTAVDGLDGFTKLQEEPFDLVVSDVEMPRLHGFELTARIRSEPGLAGLPVVLVTARESREDHERGVEVGANAYIVKSGFDQTNLLETIARML